GGSHVLTPPRSADLEVGDTSDLEVCATSPYLRRQVLRAAAAPRRARQGGHPRFGLDPYSLSLHDSCSQQPCNSKSIAGLPGALPAITTRSYTCSCWSSLSLRPATPRGRVLNWNRAFATAGIGAALGLLVRDGREPEAGGHHRGLRGAQAGSHRWRDL